MNPFPLFYPQWSRYTTIHEVDCNILERKQLENLSKTQYIFRFWWILFTWVLKKEWMGLIKVLGWEKKQLHVLVL